MLASRLHIVVCVLAMGCTGTIEEDVPGGLTPEQELARKAWVIGAQPTLSNNCAMCHDGTRPEVAWLEGAPDIYAQKADLLMYENMIVNLNVPMNSMLLKKGAHEGPALTASQLSGVLDWIQKERDAGAMSAEPYPVKTTPFVVMPCMAGAPGTATCPYNDVLLDAAGAAGAKVQFTATDASGSLYLSSLKIIPGPTGVYAEHPIFVTVPAVGEPTFDPLDRYGAVMLNLPANAPAAMQQLGNGTASFVGFKPTDPFAVYFKAVGPMK